MEKIQRDIVIHGKYRHFRTKQCYEIIGIAVHSETLEPMVVYKALYDCKDYGPEQLWVRPQAMFLETVEHQGERVYRFECLE